ncbi:MAG: hypothetical protein SOZ43_04065 [Eubacteriales bacterium]|nr:hypothetical protein [Eubacteriales bacterium]
MKTGKQKKQMWITLSILAVLVLSLLITGILLTVKNCNKTDSTEHTGGTKNNGSQYETPIDFFN